MDQGNLLKRFISRLSERPTRGRLSNMASLQRLCAVLLSETGDVATLRIAREILRRYEGLCPDDKIDFFAYLARDLDISPDCVVALAGAYQVDQTADALTALMRAAEPPRQELLRRLNRLAGGTERLISMRCDLLACLEHRPPLARVDIDFRHLLASWFNPGFLELRPISWRSPANILEKIIQYEAVHEIRNWQELRLRLQPADRRCYAYFHPSLPDEPLIFVEVALSKGIPASIQSVLADDRQIVSPDTADTAVFYSISNCQSGLRAISFGNALIKRVVEDLSNELRQLKAFVTLSPIPGFSSWLKAREPKDDGGEAVLLREANLRQQAAAYLITAKRSDGYPADSVTRFHLGNGAIVHDVHACADISEKGLRQSHGVMVNYLYSLDKVEGNIDAYAGTKRIATSHRMQSLLKMTVNRSAN